MRTLAGILVLAALSAGCRFGLDYSGDTTGLSRRDIPVEGREDTPLSYLINENPEMPRVIFIHGSPGDSRSYADYLRDLNDVAEVIAVDRLGYGGSAGAGTVLPFEEHAASIAPLLQEQGGMYPIVVGHSLGGPIAARLAADYPDRIGVLIIVAGGLDADLEEPRWYNKIARWRIVQPFLVEFLKVSNREMWACHEQVDLLDGALDQITCPIVFIHGTADTLVPFETMEYSIERFRSNPHAYVLVLIGEGHSITKLRSEEVSETIREVLRGVRDFVEEDDF